MKWKGSILLLLFVVLSPIVLWAQAQRGSGRQMYDPTTETTVKGMVQDVQQRTGARGTGGGTHLMVKTDSGTIDVHVGPSDYVAGQRFSLAQGDQVEVTGSKAKVGGTDILIAREIKKGDKVLTLRNAQGIPKWSRGKRGASR
jgi:DNA/RNA endonuclease YhcR with UshA esterase domain